MHDGPYIGKMSARDPHITLDKIPIIRIFVPYASGALSGQQWGSILKTEFLLIPIIVTWLLLLLLVIRDRMDHPKGHLGFGILGFLLLLELGFLTGGITRREAPDYPVGKLVLLRGRISGVPEVKQDRWQAEMELQMLSSGERVYRNRSILGVTMQLTADSLIPAAGEEWQLAGRLVPVRNNGNPGETDYASILGRRDLWFRFYVEAGSPWNRRAALSPDHSFRAFTTRENLARYWQGDAESVMLLRAVCLGDRSRLTQELREAYAGAGGMHLLAVSGLHVGLIWWVLQHLFSVLVRVTRSELSRVLPTLVLLWYYAYLTGMTSSVTRSVTMFTLFTVARLIHHRTHPVQTIMVAAFLMTVVMPGRLREVGFQLSYSAVLGIVTLYPLLRRLPCEKIRNRFLRWIRDASAVSLAAQVATAPLVIFYFRQYPAYAMLTNLVAIPLMGGLIALFVLSVPFIILGWFPMVWNRLLMTFASGLNHLMESVAQIPGAVLPVVGADRVMLLCWLPILLLGILALNGRLRLYRYGILLVLVILNSYTFRQLSTFKNSGELLVAQFYNGTLLLIREGRQVDCYRWHADSALVRTMEQYVTEEWGGRGTRIRWIEKGDKHALNGQVSSWRWLSPDLGRVGNDRIRGWLINRTPSQEELELVGRYPGSLVMISGEPSLPADWLNDLPEQCRVVFDGTCRDWYLERLTVKHPRIHPTSRYGAYRETW